ncbi:MAG: hypothetical protein JNG88_06950 [Phycisphaerales bacterium]|nr:hypothetical protein [Phycisphaerales bacterium]
MRTHAKPAEVTALLLIVACGGCAQWNYQQLKIGQGPAEYDRILPADQTRRTEGGIASWSDDPLAGRSDATIAFLSRDRRIAGRFLTSRVERIGLRREVEVTLEGELDPRLAALERTGPIDILRALLSELAQFQGEQLARDANAYTAATIARMIAAWPGTDTPAQRMTGLSDYMDRVPSGGETTIVVDREGVIRFGYHVVAPR